MSSINKLDLSEDICTKDNSIQKVLNENVLNKTSYEDKNIQIGIPKQIMDGEETFIDFNCSGPSSSSSSPSPISTISSS